MNLSFIASLSSIVASAAFETDRIPTPSGKDISITFFGHSSLMLTFDDKVYHIDPVEREADYSKTPKADYIFVTHEHGDHLDAGAIGKLKKAGTLIVCNSSSRSKLGEGKALANGETFATKDFSVEAVPAYNTTPDHLQYHPRGRDNGYILTLGEKRIYFAGDTEDIPEMRALREIDVAFLPMNQPYTMTCRQVAEAAKSFMPKILYPYHFGETDTSELVKLLHKVPSVEVRMRRLA